MMARYSVSWWLSHDTLRCVMLVVTRHATVCHDSCYMTRYGVPWWLSHDTLRCVMIAVTRHTTVCHDDYHMTYTVCNINWHTAHTLVRHACHNWHNKWSTRICANICSALWHAADMHFRLWHSVSWSLTSCNNCVDIALFDTVCHSLWRFVVQWHDTVCHSFWRFVVLWHDTVCHSLWYFILLWHDAECHSHYIFIIVINCNTILPDQDYSDYSLLKKKLSI